MLRAKSKTDGTCAYLVMCEISHQSYLNVGVVSNAPQNLGTLKSSLWV